MNEDEELRLIEQRKLLAMRRKLEARDAPAPAVKNDREVVEGVLYDRGDEVLEAAYSFYPRETERLVGELAGLVKSGRLKDRVSGGELYSIFRQVGLRFRLKTSIRVQDKGKLVDLSEKLSRRE
ncbi:MAG: double-stranded DNA-binding protein [archaeon]|nr:MAG: double-stranded DNA-binding protein [archaeon]